MFDFFAVTNRGIENICAAEVAQLRGAHHIRTGYRRVHGAYSGAAADLLTLRTVDDVFIYLADWQGIGPHRSTLPLLQELALDLDLWQAVNVRSQLQPLRDEPAFSVSANFVGRRNYSSDEIKEAIARSVEQITGWHYTEDDRQGEINLRVFIEHESALVGMRLGASPLYKRTYKQEHLAGSLKPSVAAALVFLAQPTAGQRVLDPCCGVGTILIEAAALGVNAVGGDQDASAVAAAQTNATQAGVTIDVQKWDARSLPLTDASVEHVVCNLPWGRQVEVNSELEEFYQSVCAEIERVHHPSGKIVLLTSLPHLLRFSKHTIQEQIEISLFGQQPTIVVAGAESHAID